MPRLSPVLPDAASEAVAKTYGRLAELFDGDVPELFQVCGNVEPFLRDFYMNFKKFVYNDGGLDARTKAIIALAVASHAKSNAWIDFYAERCRQLGVTDEQVAEIFAVTATNFMYNTFFKFRDLSGTDLFEGMGVGLRAHTFSNTSLTEQEVELINIAISDINACAPCTSGHVDAARKAGLSNEQLLECIQCAGTVYAGAQFLNSAGY